MGGGGMNMNQNPYQPYGSWSGYQPQQGGTNQIAPGGVGSTGWAATHPDYNPTPGTAAWAATHPDYKPPVQQQPYKPYGQQMNQPYGYGQQPNQPAVGSTGWAATHPDYNPTPGTQTWAATHPDYNATPGTQAWAATHPDYKPPAGTPAWGAPQNLPGNYGGNPFGLGGGYPSPQQIAGSNKPPGPPGSNQQPYDWSKGAWQ